MTAIKDKCALVTGAGSSAGIGFAAARLLAARGVRLAITSTTRRILSASPGSRAAPIAIAPSWPI
jgi:3-oxoacyl-[acyl-carrier protein] reductase